jgi:hypothetical protein
MSSAPHAADIHDLIRVHGVRVNNVKDVSIAIPKRRLTVFTGVSGSGKSSLVHGSIAAGADVVSIDQDAIRGSRRSNPATYTGLLDPIRKAFAKANGVKPALFSANSEGACPNCNGAGVIYTDLVTMAGVATTRRSWRTPTGSSTSAPAPATTAGGSSSRARPPTSSPRAPPSPASTSPPTPTDSETTIKA